MVNGQQYSIIFGGSCCRRTLFRLFISRFKVSRYLHRLQHYWNSQGLRSYPNTFDRFFMFGGSKCGVRCGDFPVYQSA
jgi:hypothetical protein